MKILVTGGAGYIGSHVTQQLLSADHDVVVYDNLSTGHDGVVGNAELVVADLADRETLAITLRGGFDAVMHFAANIVVPESVANPLKYYGNNTRNTLGLVEAVVDAGVPHFIFSSTAAVYGIPDTDQVTEDTPLAPINPYGWSKLMSERMLMDAAAASSLKYGILRYFNVAGADPEGRIGQATPEATHLIKVACETALGVREGMQIFGTDYATADGTCVRDYIHVVDLADAHVALLEHLAGGGESDIFNCGYGHGYSVRGVIDSVGRAHGQALPVSEAPRRAGDPPALVADSSRLKQQLGWAPRLDELDTIVRHAYQWERRYQVMRQG